MMNYWEFCLNSEKQSPNVINNDKREKDTNVSTDEREDEKTIHDEV